MSGIPLVTAAIFLYAAGKSRSKQNTACNSSLTTNPLTSVVVNSNNIRMKNTPADLYYQEHQELPRPSKVHTTLPELAAAARLQHRDMEKDNDASDCPAEEDTEGKNILVIGDVHGCYDELLELHEKAVQENGAPFSYVILVGDLCNKGPYSAKVIRHVRTTPRWFSVRGNHDNASLQAAIGDKKRLEKSKYAWIKETDEDQEGVDKVVLSDEDVQWLSDLPYTITIPREWTGDEEGIDTIIVHAGFIPGIELEEQEMEDMITIRDIGAKCDKHGNFKHFKPHEKGKKKALVASSPEEAKQCDSRVTWASAWFGPQRVIFGHNAKRRLQIYPGHWAIGLDTGAVYGGELTGMILPGRKLVSIPTKAYSLKDSKNEPSPVASPVTAPQADDGDRR